MNIYRNISIPIQEIFLTREFLSTSSIFSHWTIRMKHHPPTSALQRYSLILDLSFFIWLSRTQYETFRTEGSKGEPSEVSDLPASRQSIRQPLEPLLLPPLTSRHNTGLQRKLPRRRVDIVCMMVLCQDNFLMTASYRATLRRSTNDYVSVSIRYCICNWSLFSRGGLQWHWCYVQNVLYLCGWPCI